MSEMTTMTVTAVSSPLTGSFPLSQKEQNPEVYVEAICEILEKYKDWKDPLSKKLFAWGVDVISIDLERMSQTAIDQRVLGLADELASKILLNPLDHSPLVKPMLDRSLWVWEKESLDDYRYIAPKANSPFDNKPFDVTPHHFALDILEWTRALPIDIHLLGKAERAENKQEAGALQVLIPREKQLGDQQLRFATYCIQALSFVTTQLKDQNAKLNDTIAQGTKRLEAFKDSVAQLARQEAERAEAAAKAHFDSVETTITANAKVHSTTVAVLNSSLQDTNHRLTKRTEELNASLGQVETLKQQVANQNQVIQDLSSTVNDLRNKPKEKGKCLVM